MNRIWLQILAVLLGSSILKYFFVNVIGWVIIDLAALAVCYMILRKGLYIDVRKSMLYLSGLTLLNILVDLGIISGLLGNIIMLAIIMWMILGRPGGGPKRPVLRHKWHK